MEDLLIQLIRWCRIAAIAAIVTALIVLVAHWPRRFRFWDHPAANASAIAYSNAIAPQAEYQERDQAEVIVPDIKAPAVLQRETEQPVDATAPVISTPAVNLQPDSSPVEPPAVDPGSGVGEAFVAPTPVVNYGGPEWKFGVTVREKPHHAWPRRFLGGIGHGIGKVMGFRRR